MLLLVSPFPSFLFALHVHLNNTELHVKTVKYFRSIERVQEEVEKKQAETKAMGVSADEAQQV
jgi:hypothetical protein